MTARDPAAVSVTPRTPAPRVLVGVFAGFALFFLLLLLPLPLNQSIMGSTDTLLGIGLSNGYLNAVQAKVTGEPIGRAMYPAQPARFGEAGFGAAAVFILLRAIGLDDVWALYLFQAILLTLMALATFLVARIYVGNIPAAIVAGFAFTTSNYLWSNIDDLPVHFYFLPLLSLYFLKSALVSGRMADLWRVAGLGGLQAYFSFQVFAYQTLMLGVVALINVRQLRDLFPWRQLLAAAAAYSALALPMFILYVSTVLLLNPQDVWIAPRHLSSYRLQLSDLITHLPHKIISYPFARELVDHGGPIKSLGWSVVRDSAFLGLMLPALALLGLRPTRQHAELLAIGALGLLLATGGILEIGEQRLESPLNWVYSHIPFLKYVRVSLRGFSLSVFALSVLAAFGVARLSAAAVRRSHRAPRWSAAAAVMFIGAENISWPLNVSEIIKYPAAPPSYITFFEDKPVAVLLDLPATSTSWPGYVDETVYMLWQTKHRRAILGGVNGYYPPSRLETQNQTDMLPSESSIRYFRSLGLTHFVVHDSPHLRQLREPTTFSASLKPGETRGPELPQVWAERVAPLAHEVFADESVRIFELKQSSDTVAVAQPEQVRDALRRAVTYLASVQRPNGSFANWTCLDRGMLNCRPDETVFVATFVLHALDFVGVAVPEVQVNGLRQKVIDLLTATRLAETSFWRYSTTLLGGYAPYPADLDDTSCASAALVRNRIEFPDNLARLMQLERTDGSFPTWLERSAMRREDLLRFFDNAGLPLDMTRALKEARHWDLAEPSDCAVNANLMFYLGVRGQPRPSLCRYLNDAVAQNRFPRCSQYYDNPLVFDYFITRAFADGNATCLQPSVTSIAQRIAAGTPQTPTDRGLTAVSLMNAGKCGQFVDGVISRLLSTQRPDGSWIRGDFYLPTLKLAYYGSESLTTAIAVEALAKYLLRCRAASRTTP